MDFKWPMKKQRLQHKRPAQLEPDAETVPLSRPEENLSVVTLEVPFPEGTPAFLDSIKLNLPRSTHLTFKTPVTGQKCSSTILQARDMNSSSVESATPEDLDTNPGPPALVILEAREFYSIPSTSISENPDPNLGSSSLVIPKAQEPHLVDPTPATTKVRFLEPGPSTPSIEPIHRLKLKLNNLVRGKDFEDMSIPQVVEQLQQLVKTFASFPPTEPKGNVAAIIHNRDHPMRVPNHVKKHIFEKQIPRGLKTQIEPIVGFTAYIGSPVNGEMIIANAGVVDTWLTFIRSAASKKLLQKEGGFMKASTLSLLVNLVEIPEGRHSFNLTYGEESYVGCGDKSHTHFIWRSGSYPCSVRSCKNS